VRLRIASKRSSATIAASAMLFAGLTAVAIQPASAAPQVFEVHSDQVVNVPTDVNMVTLEIHGAAGGAGGQTGGSPGRGAVETIQVPVTPGQAISVGVGQHGGNAALAATTPAGGGGVTGGGFLGHGGGGGKGANGAFGTYGAAGGGGGGATSVYLDGNLIAVAGGGGGGGGTNALTSPGGNGGNADDDGEPGSDIPNASGGENGDAPTPAGGPGEDATGAVSGGGGAGGGGGGYAGGSGGAFTAIVAGSSGGGGGGGDSYVDSAKATQLSRVATEAGNGYVTFTYSQVFNTTTTFTNTPYDVTNRQSFGYTIHVNADGAQTTNPVKGTVELSAESQLDGTVIPLGTKNLDSSGNVKIFSDKLKAGDYVLTAAYTPTGASVQDSKPSQSTQNLTVSKGDTNTLISGPADPPNYGDDVTFGVSVTAESPAQGTPSGKVQFSTGSGNLDGPVTLDADGKATLTTHHLPVGTVDISAQYLGDDEFNGSLDELSLKNFVVNPGDTTVVLTEEHNPTISGENAYFDVQVTPTSAVAAKPAAGTKVDLYDGSDLIDSGVIDSHGHVGFVESFLATNDNDHHHMRAVFNPGGGYDPNFDESVSAFLDAVVNYGDVKVDVTSDVNPQRVGKDVTFTIHVKGLKPTSYPYDPTGDVQLYVNGTAFNAPITIDGSGNATVTTSDLPVGDAHVYAEYKGDDHYKGASSNVLEQIINPQLVSVSLTSNGSPKQYGQEVVLTAHVTGESIIPKGSITFFDGTKELGTVAVDANGDAKYSSKTFTRRTHEFSATYEADNNSESGTSNVLQVTVLANLLKMRLATSGIPAYAGQTVIIHSKLSKIGDSAGKIEGVVQYYSNDKKIGGSIPVSGTKGATIVLHHVKTGKYRIVGKFKPKTGALYSIATSDTLIQVVKSGKPNATINMSVKRLSTDKGLVRVHVRKTNGDDATGHVRIYVDGAYVKTIVLSSHGMGSYTLTGLPDEDVLVTVAYLGRGHTKPVSREAGLHR
jgi:hypothetical protein